jgi:pimeloyl-ACP methyl ester carboxylesterase
LDQQIFIPELTIKEWTAAAGGGAPPGPGEQPGLLGNGFGHNVRGALLMPVRQLSFWAMKYRARSVGGGGVHALLAALQQNAPQARFHLMGHSFGCIVVSAAISGPLDRGAITSRLPRPVDSLFLVQGALSLWSFAESIPFPPGLPGYFHPIDLPPALRRGPVVTTRSKFDHAVGTFFPLAAKLGNELLLGEELPEHGGVGAFGIQGTSPATTHDLPVLNASAQYRFEAGQIYNVDASTVICHGGWPSGAHSDIAHPEIAHLFWQAAMSGIANKAR